MASTLKSSYETYQPPFFSRTDRGDLIVTNGLSRPQRWDGVSSALENAGIDQASDGVIAAGAGAGSNVTDGEHSVGVRFVDDEGTPGDLQETLATVTTSSATSVDYSSIPVSTDPRVTAVQIFRSKAGDASVLYLVASVANGSTSLAGTDTYSDTALGANTALPILASDNSLVARRFGVPPAKAVSVHHQERMWYGVDVDYSDGHLEVTNGSATVNGIGTAFTVSMVGRYLYVVGSSLVHQITAVASATSLSVSQLDGTASYGGTTDKFAIYAIRSSASEQNTIYYSSPGEPEAVPSVNALRTQDDGDRVTALLPMGAFLYVLKRYNTYRITFGHDPAVDGGSYHQLTRGCCSPRSLCKVGGVAYIMDFEGIYEFDGGSATDISHPIRDYFRAGKINWSPVRWFWAEHFPVEETVKFFVALGSTKHPRHALCYNYGNKRWHVEFVPWRLGGGAIGNFSGQKLTMVGGEHETVWRYSSVSTDGISSGDSEGSLTQGISATNLHDTSASYSVSGVVDLPLAIISGAGDRQFRRVVRITSGQLKLLTPLLKTPAVGDGYILGAIQWSIKTGAMPIIAGAQNQGREVAVTAQPTDTPTEARLQTWMNHDTAPVNMQVTIDNDDGLSAVKGDPDIRIDLASSRSQGSWSGYAAFPFDAYQGINTLTDRWVSFKLYGWQARSRVKIHGLEFKGLGIKQRSG